MRARLSLSLAGLALACTPRPPAIVGPAPEPASPAQPIVREAEPEPEAPALVAPSLPALAPVRPLAHLELRWQHHYADEPAAHRWTVGTRMLGIPDALAEALGLAGPPEAFAGLGRDEDANLERAGSLVIAASIEQYTAYEVGTGGVVWKTPAAVGRSYLHVVGQRVLVTVFNHGSGEQFSAWALEDGRRLWTRTRGFESISALETDGERGYLTSDAGLEAFDLVTGETSWTMPLADPSCGFAVDGDRVVVEDPQRARILDAELGTELGRVGPVVGHCLLDYFGSGLALDDGRYYVFDGSGVPRHEAPDLLRAYDLDTQAELWSVSGFDSAQLVADHDAVYLTRGSQTFVALDAATGTVAYEYGIGQWFWIDVQPVGGEAGPLVIIEDDEQGLRIFARGTRASAPESWEVRGRLVSDHLDKKRLREVEFEVNGVEAKTDGRGRFVVRGTGRGVVRVEVPFDDESSYDPNTWTRVEFGPQQVELDGSGSYDLGEIESYEGYIE